MSESWRIIGFRLPRGVALDLATHRRFRSREAAVAYVMLHLDALIVNSEADLRDGSDGRPLPRVYIERVDSAPGRDEPLWRPSDGAP